MIVDHRTYTLHSGKAAEYVATYQQHGLAIQTRHLGAPFAYMTSDIGPLNQIVHLWVYPDLADREARRQRLAADPDWNAYLKLVRPLISTQENKILKMADFVNLPTGGAAR